MKKPLLAITIGDPAGIGPEIVFKSLRDPSIYKACKPLVIGDAQILSSKTLGISAKIRTLSELSEAQFHFGTVDVLHVPSRNSSAMPPGIPSRISGESSAAFVRVSVQLALGGLAQGVVHAPISKTAWRLAGVRYTGHTEMIAQLCGAGKIAMAIASEPLRTILVTRHIPLKAVSSHLKKKDIMEALDLARIWMHQRGILRPRIGVCALNPHAGESGLLGQEEIRTVRPAVRDYKKKNKNSRVSGPLAADSAYRDHKEGKFDCLITLYHDQSLIPLKLHNHKKLVNITIGLPFPRTSPGHGTAFDIAGKNCADPEPMKEAIRAAAELCKAFQ